jgi:hypothetical protein
VYCLIGWSGNEIGKLADTLALTRNTVQFQAIICQERDAIDSEIILKYSFWYERIFRLNQMQQTLAIQQQVQMIRQ